MSFFFRINRCPLKKGMNLLGIEWQNSTFGQKETASKEGTTGEIIASAMDRKLKIVSDVVEPVTRISLYSEA
jgi:putative transposase